MLRVRVYERLEALAPAGLPAFRQETCWPLRPRVDALQDLMIRVIPPYGIAVVAGIPTVAVVSGYFLPPAGVVLAVALLIAAAVVPRYTHHLATRREGRQAAAPGGAGPPMCWICSRGRQSWSPLAPPTLNWPGCRQPGRGASWAAGHRHVANGGVGAGLTTLLTGLAVWEF